MNPGGIVEKETSIHISNVAHIDPKTDRPTRVGIRVDEGGRKLRVARRSNETIDS
jgi:large subunit ribosomal protein L24